MPYIKTRRDVLEAHPREAENAGELNFAITSLLSSYVHAKGPSYQTYNEVIGALECIKLELYRRVVGKYEDQKIAQNGDVYPDWMLGKTGRAAMVPDEELEPIQPVQLAPGKGTEIVHSIRDAWRDGLSNVMLPKAEIVRLEEANKRHPNQPHEFTDAEMFDLRSSLQARERRVME